jgi:hypothetical protein
MEPRQPQDASSAPGARRSGAGTVHPRAPHGRARRWGLGLLCVGVVLGLLVAFALVTEPEYAYLPPLTKVLNPERGNQEQAFDV